MEEEEEEETVKCAGGEEKHTKPFACQKATECTWGVLCSSKSLTMGGSEMPDLSAVNRCLHY